MRFVGLVLKNIARSRRRSLLMTAGMAVAIFVITALLTVEAGFGALVGSAEDTLLNVREKGLACPVTSRVYDSYLATVGRLPAVRSATGVLRGLYTWQDRENLVVVSGVDYGAFRGLKDVQLLEGTEESFAARADAALVGRPLATQHGWKVGQTIAMLEDRLTFTVAGIFAAPDKSYETGVLLHKDYLARVTRDEGKSTFLVVRLADPAAMSAVSKAIDTEFANAPKPTKTQSERAARERELQDFREFRRMLGLMVLAAIGVSVFGAANSVSMSVRERTREVGILRSLGLRRAHILQILVGESVLVSLAGGAVGAGLAAVLMAGDRTMGGMIPLALHPSAVAVAAIVSVAVGLAGAIVPAVRAAGLPIVQALKSAE